MTRVLLTAFEPYGTWRANASWLALMELTRDLPSEPQLTTRRYPVEFSQVRRRLQKDLEANYDFALHLGQAPGSGRVQLESIGVNVRGDPAAAPGAFRPLDLEGPVAYRSGLPLGDWAEKLRAAGIPAQVSYHAGTYLCNATLYWSHLCAERMGLRTRSAFIHLPLDVSQTVGLGKDTAALPTNLSVAAIRLLLNEMLEESGGPSRAEGERGASAS